MTDRMPAIKVVMMPKDTNAHGTIFGGWVMAQVDIAGSIPAWDRAQGPVVTVAVNSFVFKEAVFVGDLVSGPLPRHVADRRGKRRGQCQQHRRDL